MSPPLYEPLATLTFDFRH